MPQAKVRKALEEVLPVTMLSPLKYVERLLSQNKYHFRQIAYKNYPISLKEFDTNIQNKEEYDNPEGEEDLADQMMKQEIQLVSNVGEKPCMKFLFKFSGKDILKGEKYIVNCLDWNPLNPDLLAAGYGDRDIDSRKEGLLCFWTLKNPLHPERVIVTPRGISCCHFSNKNPYYIVCGDYSGEIMIYDLRSQSNKPLADSTELKDKHNDIVWECKWVYKPNDPNNEMIISISSDGKVKEWFLKKGLEVSDILIMKKNLTFPDKTLSPFSKYEKSNKEGLIFREANGLSFDFPNNDTTVYYIALEECTLHRCRISYKDQYTDTYYGHQGPAYKIRCNPFDPNYLISCSYDWTIKIWNSKHYFPMLNCHSQKLEHQVNDVEWSPFTSTIFGCVADDGRIEIWDLAKQTIEPIIKEIPDSTSNVSRKCFKFSKTSQVIATGNNDFEIDIYRLYNLEHVQV
jgi:WD40 repeat protein